jgi:hypothetical protein
MITNRSVDDVRITHDHHADIVFLEHLKEGFDEGVELAFIDGFISIDVEQVEHVPYIVLVRLFSAHECCEGADDLVELALIEALVVVRVELLVDLVHQEGNVGLGKLMACHSCFSLGYAHS